MPKRSSKPAKLDVNQLAASIVQAVTAQLETPPPEAEIKRVMAAMGRRGGLKGGKARAKSLSKKRRAEIASAAARARWKDKK